VRKNGETRGFIAKFKHHPPAVSGNSPVLSAPCAFSVPCLAKGQVQGRIVSTTGHKVVMPHGTAMCAQNGTRARRTAGNGGPENYRKSGKLSELNAGGAARTVGGKSQEYILFNSKKVVMLATAILVEPYQKSRQHPGRLLRGSMDTSLECLIITKRASLRGILLKNGV